MYAVEFQAPIENGIVHIPTDNKVMVTMELATNIDDLVLDGIL